MSIVVTSPSGWPGIPTYSITWDVFRSMTWTNEGDVTYSHGYLDANLTGGHHLIGVLRCR